MITTVEPWAVVFGVRDGGMAGVNLGEGKLNLGHLLGGVLLLAIGWFGSTVTNDHDALTKISTKLDIIQGSVDHLSQRMDCVQGVSTGGCQKASGHD